MALVTQMSNDVMPFLIVRVLFSIGHSGHSVIVEIILQIGKKKYIYFFVVHHIVLWLDVSFPLCPMFLVSDFQLLTHLERYFNSC